MQIMQWVNKNYSPVALFGAEPLQTSAYGINILIGKEPFQRSTFGIKILKRNSKSPQL